MKIAVLRSKGRRRRQRDRRIDDSMHLRRDSNLGDYWIMGARWCDAETEHNRRSAGADPVTDPSLTRILKNLLGGAELLNPSTCANDFVSRCSSTRRCRQRV